MTWGLESAGVRFGTRTALREITLKAEPGRVSVVVGGDGAGKSTLLRALVGLVPLHSGHARRPPKAEIGYIPATAGLYVDLTVDENLAFFGGAYGLRGAELARRTTDILERIGLAKAGRCLGGRPGGGDAAETGGRDGTSPPAGAARPGRADTGVDPVSRAELWRLISAAAAGGTAVVATTTYVDEAQRAATVMLLEQGRSIATGTTSEILAAIPGQLGLVRSAVQPGPLSWRWGSTWRVWAPANDLPEGAEPLRPGSRTRSSSPARTSRRCSAMTVLAEALSLTMRFGDFTAVDSVDMAVGRRGRGPPRGERSRQDHSHPPPARAPGASRWQVRLFGEVPSLRTRSRVGYVPQTLGLYDDMTVQENWAFTSAAFGSVGAVLPVSISAAKDERRPPAPRSAAEGGLRRRLLARAPSSWCSTSPPPGSGR